MNLICLNFVYKNFHILVESKHTFRGHEKPLHYIENIKRYQNFKDKIIHVIVDGMIINPNSWCNEHYQRRCIDRGIKKIEHLITDEGYILIADVDEVPRQSILEEIKKSPSYHDIQALSMKLYYYNFTCIFDNEWLHPKICSFPCSL